MLSRSKFLYPLVPFTVSLAVLLQGAGPRSVSTFSTVGPIISAAVLDKPDVRELATTATPTEQAKHPRALL